jgi:catechol 2,3-dioxygenase-like lactoylglutathione lyase family enzyme
MQQRLSLVTLGVGDFERARAFYEALGWHVDGGVDDETDQVAFFQAGGMIVALWDRAKLAHDSGVENSPGWGGVTLAYNVGSPDEVDQVINEARTAGATVVREPAKTFWGGYSAVFVDPSGHPWEVAHNPGWTVHADGRTTLS